MKQVNGKAEWMRYFAYALSALAISIAGTACGKKDEGGGGQIAVAPVVPGISTTCVGCPSGISALVASTLGRSWDYTNTEQAQLALNFFGDPATLAQNQYGSSLYYNGQVFANGILNVRVAKVAPGCVVPAGTYNVTSTMPGQWSGQQFSEMQLTASGPVQLQLTLKNSGIIGVTPAATDWAGQTFPYRTVTRMYVMSMGGGYCNSGGYPEYQFGF